MGQIAVVRRRDKVGIGGRYVTEERKNKNYTQPPQALDRCDRSCNITLTRKKVPGKVFKMPRVFINKQKKWGGRGRL